MIKVIIAPSLATIDDRERISSRPICGEPMWSNVRKSEKKFHTTAASWGNGLIRLRRSG